MADGGQLPYELNCTYFDLISGPDDSDDMRVRRFLASQAIVLAMPGVPAIYIHSLLATRNDLERVALTGRARSINRSRLRLSDVRDALDDPDSLTARVFAGLTRLIRVRREQAAFDPYAAFRVVDMSPRVFALERGEGEDALLCVVNLSGEAVALGERCGVAGFDVISGRAVAPGVACMDAYDVLWLRRDGAPGTVDRARADPRDPS